MKSELRTVDDHGTIYTALMFICPGCVLLGFSGLHMLSVNSPQSQPSWGWDGNLEAPTLSPSILTRYNDHICHSFLRDGVFEFLTDCTHDYAGMSVSIPDLQDWMIKMAKDETEG